MNTLQEITSLEDIALSISQTVNKTELTKKEPPDTWYQSLKFKLKQFSQTMKGLWSSDTQPQETKEYLNDLLIDPNRRQYPQTMQQEIFMYKQDTKGMSNLRSFIPKRNLTQNILDYYKAKYTSEVQSHLCEIDRAFPHVNQIHKPKPISIHSRKPLMIKEETHNFLEAKDSLKLHYNKKKRVTPKISNFVFGNRVISKPSNKLKKHIRPSSLKHKPSLRISSYFEVRSGLYLFS